MLRTFSEAELEQMCKKRPWTYKADVLAAVNKRPDGIYEVDTSSDAWQALRGKYDPRVPKFNPQARTAFQQSVQLTHSNAQFSGKAVQYEDVYTKAKDLIALLGEASIFAIAYAEFIQLEKRGGCRSCGRRAQLRKLMEGLKGTLLGASAERVQAVKELFPDTVFFEVVPSPLKWEDLMKQAAGYCPKP